MEFHPIFRGNVDTRIVVERRPDDWIAYATDNSAIWDCGPDPERAVENLVCTHADHFKA